MSDKRKCAGKAARASVIRKKICQAEKPESSSYVNHRRRYLGQTSCDSTSRGNKKKRKRDRRKKGTREGNERCPRLLRKVKDSFESHEVRKEVFSKGLSIARRYFRCPLLYIFFISFFGHLSLLLLLPSRSFAVVFLLSSFAEMMKGRMVELRRGTTNEVVSDNIDESLR